MVTLYSELRPRLARQQMTRFSEAPIIGSTDMFARFRGWYRDRRHAGAAVGPRADSGRPTWHLLAEQGHATPPIPVARVRREMAAAAEVSFALSEEANAYVRLLEARMASLAEDPELRHLLGATRALIRRIEAGERLLRRCGDEMEALRRSPAHLPEMEQAALP